MEKKTAINLNCATQLPFLYPSYFFSALFNDVKSRKLIKKISLKHDTEYSNNIPREIFRLDSKKAMITIRRRKQDLIIY